MRSGDKERGARNDAGVVLSHVEDVTGETTQSHGMQSRPQ